jgi:hypothetical protein
MSEADKIKINIIDNMRRLCAHCMNGKQHYCAFQELERKIMNLRGVPLMVNNEFRGMLIKNK